MSLPHFFSRVEAVVERLIVLKTMLCLWEANNVKKAGELIGVDMVLIDWDVRWFINLSTFSIRCYLISLPLINQCSPVFMN